jgi:O-antigen/teichoic acid export membrane protein
MLPLAVAGQWLLIPPFGIAGAAAATTLVAGFGAAVAVAAVFRVWQVLPPLATLARCGVISVVAYVVADEWSRAKPLILLQLAAMAIAVALALLALGELSAGERAAVRASIAARLKKKISS